MWHLGIDILVEKNGFLLLKNKCLHYMEIQLASLQESVNFCLLLSN